MITLSASTLTSLPSNLPGPIYDRSAMTPGIVHFGVGGFHRAHQAMYLDRLMTRGHAHDWSILGVGVLPSDGAMKNVMDAQDGLYTLVEKAPDGSHNARVIGSITGYLLAPDDPEAVIEAIAAPGIRIVSMTITEGGYCIDPATGEVDIDNPALRTDLEADAVPASVFGLVTEALARRRQRGLPGLTVMSCDNILSNGDTARAVFTAFAERRDAALAAWIISNVSFPNSMVDRITPATTEADRVQLASEFGVNDAWPVVCEDFEQWVVEDAFVQGRPPWEDAGVQLVHDVEPYELMKLRLLNISHQALCYPGYLAGYRLVHEVCQNPVFARYLLGYMEHEATPTLQPVPGVDLEQYRNKLLSRFSNAAVRDTLARLCAETSDRIPKWLVPVIHENLAAGRSVRYGAAIIATWARYAEGTDEDGNLIDVVDRLRDRVMHAAAQTRSDPLAFLHQRDLFRDLAEHPVFVNAYLEALGTLHGPGTAVLVAELAS
ncbi:mannitol dehydrogenase family protein [Arthrobacter tumbae]|uniref:mannitol dehydrogenase family protein n=1 Tax=Arthrobacter tumbae TaxID=163874 RepID=UPI00195DA5ED|nr:mannitol dehydrogenase family protein [Arthrobacter tumbae]MBM7781908.1 mannitol 2-dehydrogenase [Arthrobacter tumbae]